MSKADKQYFNLLHDIIDNGSYKSTRAGKTKSIFGATARFNLQDGLPLLTTKKMHTKGIIHELLWFLKGDTNIKYLRDNGIHIWDDDAYRWYESLRLIGYMDTSTQTRNLLRLPINKDEFLKAVDCGYAVKLTTIDSLCGRQYTFGDLGNVYGKQWRRWEGTSPMLPCQYDQIGEIIYKLRNNPDDRRIILSAWNVGDLRSMALPPCHYSAQFYSRELTDKEIEALSTKRNVPQEQIHKRELSCLFNCRSQDVPLGTPYNWASYAILTHMIAQCADMEVGELVWVGGDCHIYLNQLDGIQEQLTRDPDKHPAPQLWLNPEIKNIDDFKYDDIKVVGYESEATIKMPLSVG